MRKLLSSFRRAPNAIIPEGRRVYAVGDVHGYDDLLGRLLDLIASDDAGRTPAQTRIILLGDLIDRGPASAAVVARAMRPLGWARLTTLQGNHESAMVRALAGDHDMLRLWLDNGGVEAAASWGVDPEGLCDLDPVDCIERLRSLIPADVVRWLAHRPLSLEVGDYLFVHAGIRPGVPLDQQSDDDMLWIRDEFLNSRADHGAIVVHGHTPRDAIELRPNRIGLDTGAYLGGPLSAMGFEHDARWPISVRRERAPD